MRKKNLSTFKDHLHESQIYLNRTVAAAVIVASLLIILISRLTFLQINQHDMYKTLSLNNQIRIDPITPARGLLFDRNGKLLADNVPAFSLEIIPERNKNLHETISEINKIIPISEHDRKQFFKQLKFKKKSDGIPIRFKLTEEEVAKFSLEKYRFNGVDVVGRLIRHYPLGEPLAHALGYIGPISEKDQQEIDPALYRGAYYMGKAGIEKQYENDLRGTVGYRHVETDSKGRTIRILGKIPPIGGQHLHLALDSDLQKKAYDALGEYKGAIVAIDPSNGEVLALVSKPSFDPNQFVQGIDVNTYSAWRNSPDRPLFNRAILGTYPPGSTIKPMLALYSLDRGSLTPRSSIYCSGTYQLPSGGRVYRDWTFHSRQTGHGSVDLEKSIVQSCDVYYFTLAQRIGIANLNKALTKFGLGKLTEIDFPGEISGIVPSAEWKKRVRKENWYPGDTVNIGIGQGMILVTPLQLAQATATIAMRGKCFTPRLIRGLSNEHTLPEDQVIVNEPKTCVTLDHPNYWDTVISAMNKVVQSPGGTANRAYAGIPYQAAGKTGTAQVFSLKQNEKYVMHKLQSHLRDHSWFVGFAPVNDPRIAVSVILENKQKRPAARVAREIFDAFFKVPSPEDPYIPKPISEQSTDGTTNPNMSNPTMIQNPNTTQDSASMKRRMGGETRMNSSPGKIIPRGRGMQREQREQLERHHSHDGGSFDHEDE